MKIHIYVPKIIFIYINIETNVMKNVLKNFCIAITVLLCLTVCSPRFSYSIYETVYPQEKVDSILNRHEDFRNWPMMEYIGVRYYDSTVIRSYIYYNESGKSYKNISVTVYENTDTVTVKIKEGKK